MSLPEFRTRAFLGGLAQPFRGMRFLLMNRGLKRFAVLPLALNVLLYVLALVVLFHYLNRWHIGVVEWDFWGPVGGWLAWAVNWLRGGLKLVLVLAALMFAFFTFTAVGMVLASPLNDMLSEKVEVAYCGPEKKLDLPFRFTLKATFLSFWDSLKILVKQLFWTIICLPFLFIPVIGFVPLFMVGSYFAGFGFLDSAMARNFLRARHKRVLTDRMFWRLVGFGASMQILFFIPLVGLLLLPVGVASGTLIYCENDWEKLLADAGVKAPVGFVPPVRESGREEPAAPPEADGAPGDGA